MKLFGIIIPTLIALAAGSGCIPYYDSYSGYQYQPTRNYRPTPAVAHKCPGYPHYISLNDGRWIVHRPAVRPTPTTTPRPMAPQGTPGATKVLEPDFGTAATQPATANDRIEQLERRVEAIGRGTKAILRVVKKFQFDDQTPARAAPVNDDDDE